MTQFKLSYLNKHMDTTVLNSLTPFPKLEICNSVSIINHTTVEAFLEAMDI